MRWCCRSAVVVAPLLAAGARPEEKNLLEGVEYIRGDDIPGWPSPPTTDHMTVETFRRVAEDAAAKRVVHCSCGDYDFRRDVKGYASGSPHAGQWQVELPIELCSAAPGSRVSVGPFPDQFVALRDSRKIAERIEHCVNDVALDGYREDNDAPLPSDSHELTSLRLELQLLRNDLDKAKHDLARCKSDNDLFVHNEESGELQQRIHEYLRHAGATDDFLPPQGPGLP